MDSPIQNVWDNQMLTFVWRRVQKAFAAQEAGAAALVILNSSDAALVPMTTDDDAARRIDIPGARVTPSILTV